MSYKCAVWIQSTGVTSVQHNCGAKKPATLLTLHQPRIPFFININYFRTDISETPSQSTNESRVNPRSPNNKDKVSLNLLSNILLYVFWTFVTAFRFCIFSAEITTDIDSSFLYWRCHALATPSNRICGIEQPLAAWIRDRSHTSYHRSRATLGAICTDSA